MKDPSCTYRDQHQSQTYRLRISATDFTTNSGDACQKTLTTLMRLQ